MTAPKLTSPSVLKQILQAHNIRLSKRFGQNFLCDEHIVQRIAAATPSHSGLLEIGPGVGTLTLALAQRATRLIAVEIDDRLIPLLHRHLEGLDHVSVIHQDILKLDVGALSVSLGSPFAVVGNLPYQITSPLLGLVVEHRQFISQGTFMVQRELADKIAAPVGGGGGSALGVFVNAYADIERLFNVPSMVFFPRPKVDSAVFKLTFLKQPKFQAPEATFRRVVRAAFNLRRKSIRQALKQSPLIQVDNQRLDAALASADIDNLRRAETLSLEDFDQLARSIHPHTAA